MGRPTADRSLNYFYDPNQMKEKEFEDYILTAVSILFVENVNQSLISECISLWSFSLFTKIQTIFEHELVISEFKCFSPFSIS